jgi:hypothetical protein
MSVSRVEQLIVLEQIAPQLPCAKRAGFRDHVDAGPAAALQNRARQPRHETPRTCSACAPSATQTPSGLAAGDDQRAGRIKRPISVVISRAIRVPPLRATISATAKFHQRHAVIGKLAVHPRCTLTFGKRDGRLAACCELGGGGAWSEPNSPSTGPLQPARRIGAMPRASAPASPPLPHHSTGPGTAAPFSTTRSRSMSLSASKT